MRRFLLPALSVLVPYAIFASKISPASKIFFVSLLCFTTLCIYVIKLGGWKNLNNEAKSLAFPAGILLSFASINLVLDLNVSALLIWAGFLALTVASFVIAQILANR